MFIELTDVDTEKSVLVNATQIKAIKTNEYGTLVYLGKLSATCKETPSEIEQIIANEIFRTAKASRREI